MEVIVLHFEYFLWLAFYFLFKQDNLFYIIYLSGIIFYDNLFLIDFYNKDVAPPQKKKNIIMTILEPPSN